ncbi:hypothetical protein [Xanthobacter pseudotagetidis]|uniref:hypothetical protein n=1 Tax=Xanthobacter pseudotagetidis TaxID=3119911 RepID=UPI00372AB122
MTQRGELLLEGETVCFDLACALEMAESDCAWAAGACVYVFDPIAELARPRLVAAFGLSAPSSEDRRGPPRIEVSHIA